MIRPVRVRRADHREPREREADRAGRGSLADDDVELEVLHRGIEDLLDGTPQAVDLVDEEHVTLVELREDRREVAGALQRRTRRDVHANPELVCDDARQCRLAEPRRSGEQQMVSGLTAASSGLEDDAEVILQLALADELVERTRSQADFERELRRIWRRLEQLLTHGCAPTRGAAALRAATQPSHLRVRGRASRRAPHRGRSRGQ